MNINNLKKYSYFKNIKDEHLKDSLAECLNREIILGYIDYLVSNQIPFTSCLIDVDNFKFINDNFGHLIGDEIIFKLSIFFNDVIGDKGVVGRYGGDEFLVVMENITDHSKIWNTFHELNVELGKLMIPEIKNMSLSITTGIARYPIDGNTAQEVFNCSDKALYRGKTNGRNCFVIYMPDKHKDIELKTQNETSYSSMDMHARVFELLTKTTDIYDNIKMLFNYLSSMFMLDRLSIETKNGIYFKTKHHLCADFEFSHMNYDVISKKMNSFGLFIGNRLAAVEVNQKDVYDEMVKQHTKSLLLCSIVFRDDEYGIIRAESVGGSRIWQANIMDLIVTASRIIGMILHSKGLTIEEL